jgi:O-antigen ligase
MSHLPWPCKSAARGSSRRSLWTAAALVGCSMSAGFAIFSVAATPSAFALPLIAIAGLLALLVWPEMALALYVVVGDVKGDDRVAALLPFDFTLLLGAVLLAGIALKFLRKHEPLPMPPCYLLFVALIGLMAASLVYTPVFDAGIEKLARFVTVTGIVIVAPFAVLDTLGAFKRFLGAFAAAAFTICAWSLSDLGGSERLTTPSNNTIGLGHIACALILLIWFAVIPRYRLPYRILSYLLLAVPAFALIGSGSRGPAIACAAVMLVSVFFLPRLRTDLACLTLLGAVALPFAGIPETAFGYLRTLTSSPDVSSLLGFRSDLLTQAWSLFQQHPLAGVGLQGFRYASPNPALYNWPHNIFLELASELGIFGMLAGIAIFVFAVREAVRQLRDPQSPYFVLSQISAALLLSGILNATNTGDINSDRSTWLFVSLVFVIRGLAFGTERQRSALTAAIQVAGPQLPAGQS